MGKKMIGFRLSIAQRGALLVYLSNKQLESRRRALYTASEGPIQICPPLQVSSFPLISPAPSSLFCAEIQSKWALFASHPKSEVHGRCQAYGVFAFLRDFGQLSLPIGQAVALFQGEGVFVYRCILARLRDVGGTIGRRIICCGMVAMWWSRLWPRGGWECLRVRLLPVMARCCIQRINAQSHHFRPSLKRQSQLAWRLQTNQRKGSKSEGTILR